MSDPRIIVDPCDEHVLRANRWWVERHRHTYYARGRIGGKNVYLHRFLLGLTDPLVKADHIDGHGLNNRRANLRRATNAENCRAKHRRYSRANKTSPFRGVSFHSLRRKWRAYLTVDGVQKHLGLFDTEVEAARAFDAGAARYFGEFATFNLDHARN